MSTGCISIAVNIVRIIVPDYKLSIGNKMLSEYYPCRLHRIPSDFSTPKVRDSFVSKFVYDTEEGSEDLDPDAGDTASTPGVPPGGGMMGTLIPNNIGEAGVCGKYGLRYRRNATSTSLLSSPTRKLQKTTLIKKSAVSNIIWSVRRSIRGGSQLFNKRGGTYRYSVW